MSVEENVKAVLDKCEDTEATEALFQSARDFALEKAKELGINCCVTCGTVYDDEHTDEHTVEQCADGYQVLWGSARSKVVMDRLSAHNNREEQSLAMQGCAIDQSVFVGLAINVLADLVLPPEMRVTFELNYEQRRLMILEQFKSDFAKHRLTQGVGGAASRNGGGLIGG